MNPSHARGFSLLELMIGLTVGLFVLASASSVMVSQISDHRRLMLETRTEQEVRAVGELMSRELRLAGAWGRPDLGVWSEANPSPMANPYKEIRISADGARVTFSVSTAGDSAEVGEDNFVSDPEKRGFALVGGVLRSLSGGNSQPLTDADTLQVTRFQVSLVPTSFPVPASCALACNGLANCPPTITMREIKVLLDAEAKHDASVKRHLDLTVRLQTDKIEGVCRS